MPLFGFDSRGLMDERPPSSAGIAFRSAVLLISSGKEFPEFKRPGCMRHITRFLGFVFATGAIVFVIGACAAGLLVWKFERGLPDYTTLKDYEPPVMTRVHASDGSLIAEYARERRLYLPGAAIPALVKDAFISAEDKNFYTHPGVDPERILRALFVFLQGDKHVQGASTITQQVAKNFLLTNERSFERKIREMLLSFRIEGAYSKEKILELYLNEIYLGLGNYGVAAAALNYYGKSVHELTIAQAAYLAALPKAPNNYHPFLKHERAIERRNWVIDRMVENGYVTRQDGEKAKAEELGVNPRVLSPNAFAAGFFAEEVRRELSDRYGEKKLYEGGLSVRSTLDPKTQLMARRALVDGLVRYDEAHGFRGPMRHIDISQDWGIPLADIPALGDVAPWRLAVVLDTTGAGAQIGLQPHREKSGEIEREREIRRARHRRTSLDPGYWFPRVAGARRRDLCRADRGKSSAVPAAPNPGSQRRDRRDGPLYRPRIRHGRRFFVRPVRVQSGDAGVAPAGFLVQAFCLRHGTRQWLYAILHHSRRADRNRSGTGSWGVASGKLRGQIERSPYLALWGRTFDQSDDRAARPRCRDAAHRRICQALRYLRRSAALPRDVAWFRRNDLDAADHRLFDARQRRQEIKETLIDRIQDRWGHTIYRHDEQICEGCDAPAWQNQEEPELIDKREQVLDPLTAYQITSIMEGVIQRGTGQAIREVGKHLAGKTGTTNDAKDLWFIGYSPDLAVGVFMGYDQPRSLGIRRKPRIIRRRSSATS